VSASVLRHSGLTWAAASGASVADLMRRGGHASPQAALRYQHSTKDRDRAIADALAGLATPATVTSYNQKLWIHDLTKGATYPPS
jgi:integrase